MNTGAIDSIVINGSDVEGKFTGAATLAVSSSSASSVKELKAATNTLGISFSSSTVSADSYLTTSLVGTANTTSTLSRDMYGYSNSVAVGTAVGAVSKVITANVGTVATASAIGYGEVLLTMVAEPIAATSSIDALQTVYRYCSTGTECNGTTNGTGTKSAYGTSDTVGYADSEGMLSNEALLNVEGINATSELYSVVNKTVQSVASTESYAYSEGLGLRGVYAGGSSYGSSNTHGTANKYSPVYAFSSAVANSSGNLALLVPINVNTRGYSFSTAEADKIIAIKGSMYSKAISKGFPRVGELTDAGPVRWLEVKYSSRDIVMDYTTRDMVIK